MRAGSWIIGRSPRESVTQPSHVRGLSDHRPEALHPLEALGEALAPEVEDDLAHAQPRVGRDVVRDLCSTPRERPAPPPPPPPRPARARPPPPGATSARRRAS